MGRGLRHLRCVRCRQRKVKCDGAKPSCENCLRHGQQCPGYPPQFEFKDEREDLERRFRTKQPAPACTSDGRVSPQQPSRSHSNSSAASANAARRKSQPSPSRLDGPDQQISSAVRITPPPGNAITLLQSRLVHRLQLPPHLVLDIYGLTFLPFLPSHVGHCNALDSAIELLCYVHDNRINHRGLNNKMISMQTSLLNTLHEDLRAPKTDTFPETLASAIIAMNIGHNKDNYFENFMAHAAGIRALLAMRGPPKHYETFYLALVNSIWGLLWTSALIHGEAAFQETGLWQGKPHPDSDKYFIITVLGPALHPFPGIVRDVKLLGSNPELRESISRRTNLLRSQLLIPDFRIAPIQDELLQSIKCGPPKMAPFYPASAEFLAYLSSLALCLAITRRIQTIVDPKSAYEVDEFTKLDAADEIARWKEISGNANEGFILRKTTMNEYVQLTMNVMSNVMTSLEDQEMASIVHLQDDRLIQEEFSSASPEDFEAQVSQLEWIPHGQESFDKPGLYDGSFEVGFDRGDSPDFGMLDHLDLYGDFQDTINVETCGALEDVPVRERRSPMPMGKAG